MTRWREKENEKENEENRQMLKDSERERGCVTKKINKNTKG